VALNGFEGGFTSPELFWYKEKTKGLKRIKTLFYWVKD